MILLILYYAPRKINCYDKLLEHLFLFKKRFFYLFILNKNMVYLDIAAQKVIFI